MSYTAWSVTFAEQPSASKWNLLGSNDAAFHNGGGVLESGLTLSPTTYPNPGSAGGTFYYINLGGIKKLWGLTASTTYTATSGSLALTLPTSFFSTIQYVGATTTDMTGDTRQTVSLPSVDTTTVGLVAWGLNVASVTTKFYVQVIGT